MGAIIGAVAGAFGLGEVVKPLTDAVGGAVGTAVNLATNPVGTIAQAVSGSAAINY